MELTLVRHTSVSVKKGICYGQSDVPLSISFPTEAKLVIDKLEGENFDAVYSSPLSRATLLAEQYGAQFRLDSRIMEASFGEWEMLSWEEIGQSQPHPWFADWIYEAPPAGESFSILIGRVELFYRELYNTHGNSSSILCFTHGGVIAATKVISLQCDIKNAFDELPQYGSINRFYINHL